MWIVFIFVWIVEAAICYSLAEKKEKDKWWAFLMGCLFGFLAILYYLLCKKGGVPCEFCRELISKEATICSYCQKNVVKSRIN